MTWHPLSESHPDDLTLVLITDGREVQLAVRSLLHAAGESFYVWKCQDGDIYTFKPTHWCPVPTLPEPNRFTTKLSVEVRDAFENLLRADADMAAADRNFLEELGYSIEQAKANNDAVELEKLQGQIRGLHDPGPPRGVVLDFRINGKRN